MFPILIVALLASCSTTPGEMDDSNGSSSSSPSKNSDSSEFSESMDSISSETSSFESEEASSEQDSQTEEDFSSFTWGSVEEAIAFFEQTYESPQNEIQEEVVLENYDRSDWKLEEMGNNQVVLRWVNPDNPADRYYMELFKGDGFTKLYVYQGELDVYEGDTVYRATPFKEYMVRINDFKVFDSKEEKMTEVSVVYNDSSTETYELNDQEIKDVLIEIDEEESPHFHIKGKRLIKKEIRYVSSGNCAFQFY